jgi:DNA helicase HerA-like ATPase
VDVDIFVEGKIDEFFVGRPFHLDYECAYLLVADAWKFRVGGIPQGTFLLAFYENEENVEETLLLRAIKPAKLPTDDDVIRAMIEYYKDDLKTSGSKNQLDDFTRYEFGFSGLETRILGTFYRDTQNNTRFGADVENFYSSHNYSVFKPTDKVLEKIVNFRDGNVLVGQKTDIRIGKVRYSSSRRFQEKEKNEVPVYVSSVDFLGKRTALFGMTRTGKSNTVKKIIQATAELSVTAPMLLDMKQPIEQNSNPFADSGGPKFPVGQIIFDINGEYANANLQDDGTAIFEMFHEDVTRYSVIEKPGFKVMKVNFYEDVLEGFGMVQSYLANEDGDYVKSFCAVDLSFPEEKKGDKSFEVRHERRVAAYKCCLYQAGFATKNNRIKFTGTKEINSKVNPSKEIDPSKGINYEEAIAWFTWVWENYSSDQFFEEYRNKKDKEYLDQDLKACLAFLTRKRNPGHGAPNVSGYSKLRGLLSRHTSTVDRPFAEEIVDLLRNGKIVIVDLSQGDPDIQRLYSESICIAIFRDSMGRFINNDPNNFVQFYFEEAHNLFPKKEDKDLSQIYNRIAKEGAKLNLGLIYATQEVSSISGNILKNTQNWFVAHLNNDDELRELKKYYDFKDFTDGLTRFSADSDKGFVRMKTYSNPFIVPVQIDRFTVSKPGA